MPSVKKNQLKNKELSERVDKDFTLYNKIFMEGQKHQNPSPKTIEEINSLKLTMAELQGGQERIEQKLDEHIKQNDKAEQRADERADKLEAMVSKFIEGADCKYASIETVNALTKMAWLIGSAVVLSLIGAFMSLILKSN